MNRPGVRPAARTELGDFFTSTLEVFLLVVHIPEKKKIEGIREQEKKIDPKGFADAKLA